MYNSSLTHFVPRGSYVNPIDALNRVVGQLFSPELEGQQISTRAWSPMVDILETDDAYEFKAELPGVAKDDVEITVENNVLTLKGERKFEKEDSKENYHRIERAYGTFARSFTLPTRVSHDGVEAKFDNGVLTVVVPKAAEAKPRKIDIS
ncbi:MAG TPA: Hsp20/alpha crystallin family protein [Thermoanaerobaculia bacterium]|nr:Hsp20/alpha crystallin family protein [Thermoanaerobaculia bacterium]